MINARYRGKCLKTGDWVYGYLLKDCIISEDANIWSTEDDGSKFTSVINSKASRIDPKTVGQFTGKQDKNGVDIFGGSFIKNDSGRICIVEWNDNWDCWDCRPVMVPTDSDSRNFSCYDWDCVEVVEFSE